MAAALLKLARQERELAELRGQIENLARLAGGARRRPRRRLRADPGTALVGDSAETTGPRRSSGSPPGLSTCSGPATATLPQRLAPCWREHTLCLYLLDWLSELWTVLYSADQRGYGLLASQAELQTRILPAAADQLGRETTGCDHELASTRRFR